MRLFYDSRADTAYIALRDPPTFTESMPISEHVRLDIGIGGKVCGIELLEAGRQLLSHDRRFIIETFNHLTGRQQEIRLDW